MGTLASDAIKNIRPDSRFVQRSAKALRFGCSCALILCVILGSTAKSAHATGSVSTAFVSCSNYLFQNAHSGYEKGGYTSAAAACTSLGLGAYAGNGNYYCGSSTELRALCMAPVNTCPAHSTGTPATNPTTCTCNDPSVSDPTAYVPDSIRTSCVPSEEQYTLSVLQHPLPDVEPGKSASPYVEVVNALTSLPKEGAVVNIKIEVNATSGGHDHGESVAKRNKGTLSGCTAGTVSGTIDCITGPNGRASFNFGAPDDSGTHKFTATCISHACSGSKTSEINVKVDGLWPIPGSVYYALTESDGKGGTKNVGDNGNHSGNHYLTNDASMKLWGVARDFYDYQIRKGVAKPTLMYLNDASLKWGGKFDIQGNWTGYHYEHDRGVVIDIRANTINEGTNTTPGSSIPESMFIDFQKMAAKNEANAKLHCSADRDPAIDNCVGDLNRHYHLILN